MRNEELVKMAPLREPDEEKYKISLANDMENLVSITYKGIQLKGVTGFAIDTSNGSPVIKLTITPDFIECNVDFRCPPQNQYP